MDKLISWTIFAVFCSAGIAQDCDFMNKAAACQTAQEKMGSPGNATQIEMCTASMEAMRCMQSAIEGCDDSVMGVSQYRSTIEQMQTKVQSCKDILKTEDATEADAKVGAVAEETEKPLEVFLRDLSTRTLELGSEVSFTCVVNQELNFMLEHDVDWHIAQDWVDQSYYLVDKIKLMKDADPEFYSCEYKLGKDDEGSTIMEFIFTIKKVRARDDGKLTCGSGGVVSEIQIVVIQPMNSVSLQLDNLPAITENQAEAVLLDSSEHTIVCKAMGSNPGTTDVQITLAGEKVETGDVVIEQDIADLRTFTSTVTAKTDIKFKPHHGQDIQCIATDTVGTMLSVKMPVQINTPEPNITCATMETYPGKRMVMLECSVDHKDIRIDSYSYKITQGSKFDKVKAGETKTINGKMVKVVEEKKGSDKSTLKLQLAEVQNGHFSGSIHLVVESSGGHLTEGLVKLKKIQEPANKTKKGPTGGSPMMAASLATVLLASLLACVL